MSENYQKAKDIFIQRRTSDNKRFEEYPFIVQPSSVVALNAANDLTVIPLSFFAQSSQSVSASSADTASHAISSSVSDTSSYAFQALSSSYSETSSFALNVPETASYALRALSASYADNGGGLVNGTSSWSTSSISASVALTASYLLNAPDTASYALQALSSSNATYAVHADSSSYSLTASYVPNPKNAETASYLTPENNYTVNNLDVQGTLSASNGNFVIDAANSSLSHGGGASAIFAVVLAGGGSATALGAIVLGTGTAEGIHSLAHGGRAIGEGSHAEGYGTYAIGDYSHAEGRRTYASGNYSHAEGYRSSAEGSYTHAEGGNGSTDGGTAVGGGSHAEGGETIAIGTFSHAEGYRTGTKGAFSHAEGWGTKASGSGQTVVGHFNTEGNETSLFVVGGGSFVNSKDLLQVNPDGTVISESLLVHGPVTASHFEGTASWAENASSVMSASYAQTASIAESSSWATIPFNGNRTIKRSPYTSLNVGGTNVVDFLNNFFFPFIPATITLAGGTSLYQIGTTVNFVLNPAIIQQDETIFGTGSIRKDGAYFYEISPIPPYTDSTTDTGVTSNHTYVAYAQVDNNGSPTIINSAARNISFIYPYLWGMSTTPGLSGTALYSAFTKQIVSSGNKTVNLVGNVVYIYFAYPATYPALTSILDPNSFEVIGNFEYSSSVSVTSVGLDSDWTTNYRVYRTALVSDPNGNYQFKQT